MTVARPVRATRWRNRSWLLPAVLLLAAAGAPGEPQSRMSDSGWARRFDVKQQGLHAGSYDILLLGDSITKELENTGDDQYTNVAVVWQRYFACRRAFNLGFSGDTTANLLWRLQNGELDGVNPKLIVLLIGTNNMRASLDWSADQTAAAITSIVALVNQRLPGAKLLLLSIPPNGLGPRANDTIHQVNAILAARDWTPMHTTYLAFGDVLAPGGTLDADLFRETHLPQPRAPLHPDAEGWDRIAATIMPTIDRLSGRSANGGAPCPGALPAP